MSETTQTPDAQTEDQRGSRRVIIGTVTSSTMDKTCVVTVVRRVRDRRFHKFLTNRVKYHVHDENNAAKVGDLVEIIESRPMSKTKRWRLLKIVTRGIEGATLSKAEKAEAAS